MTMDSYPAIALNSKISLDFRYPLKKQTFTNDVVHPAVMISLEENVTLQGPLETIPKGEICKSGAVSNGNCEVSLNQDLKPAS